MTGATGQERAGDAGADARGGVSLRQLPISAIVPSRFQTRDTFDEAALDELAQSIREVGVLQPVLVRPNGDGVFELVAGERRWRAARRAGLDMIPAVVRTTEDRESVVHVLVENLQREDLDVLEEAAGYQQLISELGLTHEACAARVGKSRAVVTNGLRLLQLTPSIQKLIKTRELSASHARALLNVPDKGYQEQLAKRVVAEGMSVRQVEAAVQLRQELAAGKSGKAKRGGAAGSQNGQPGKPAALLELEEILGELYSTRVQIEMGPKNGRVVVEFADIEDLERIFSLMSAVDDPAGPSNSD